MSDDCRGQQYFALLASVGFFYSFALPYIMLESEVLTRFEGREARIIGHIVAVRRRRYLQHQEWMIRSYVVTLGFVFFRMFVGITSALEVGTQFDRLNAASWFCWAFPLLITEAVIQGRKIIATPVPS